jgi:uncharacterized LabA/DUF88 family protein
MMKTVLLLDGGYLRATAQNAGVSYDVQFIERFSRRCFDPNEYLLRVLYYDAPQYEGVVQLPVSGKNKMFKSKDTLLDDLAKLERFACRKGSLGFRGWKPRSIPIAGGSPLTDSDFQPVFEQKGVDMRVGLDIAEFADRRSVDRIILVTGDTGMIPAMKHARKAGVEVVIAQLPAPARRIHDDLPRHADLVRAVAL